MYTLDLYEGANLEKIASNAPFLAKDVEYDLIEKVQSQKCQNSAAKLVTSHLRYVVSIAKNYSVGTYKKSDLVHEGVIGLLKAINRFDMSLNFRLSTFSKSYIASEIKEFVANNFGVVKVNTTKEFRKVFFNQAKINKAKASGNLDSELDKIGVSKDTLDEMERRMNVQHYVPFDLNSEDEDSFEYQLGEYDDYSSADRKAEKGLVNDLIVNTLNQRERFVIYSRFMSDSPLKRREIAEIFNVKQQRVEQIEKKALERLREKLELSDSLELTSLVA